MKGTDCTPEQVAHAAAFITSRGWPAGVERAEITLEQFARMLAWYGAIRYVAARDKTGGTLEAPGQLITRDEAGEWKPEAPARVIPFASPKTGSESEGAHCEGCGHWFPYDALVIGEEVLCSGCASACDEESHEVRG